MQKLYSKFNSSNEIKITTNIIIDGLKYGIDENIVYVLSTENNIHIFFNLMNILHINDNLHFASRMIYIPERYVYDKHAFIIKPETEYYNKTFIILDSHKHRLYIYENKYFAFTLFNIVNSIISY